MPRTVFLGIDHSTGFGSKPILFESDPVCRQAGAEATAIIYDNGQEADIRYNIVERYSAYSEAEQGHIKHVEALKAVASAIRSQLNSCKRMGKVLSF